MLDDLFTPSHLIFLSVFFLFPIAIYILLTIVAVYRNHHNRVSIILTNILLGWTVIGWVVALVWSFSSPVPSELASQAGARSNG